METFLRTKAIVQEKKHISRTYLIFTSDGASELVAYFTVAVNSMNVTGIRCSSSLQKKMNINDNYAQSYLIGQLGKCDGSERGLGTFAIERAIKVIEVAESKVGCRLVRLDCRPSLIGYYEKNGFVHVRHDPDHDLELMVRIIGG